MSSTPGASLPHTIKPMSAPSCPPTSADILDALSNPRVLRAIEIALRDRAIRREFQRLRGNMTSTKAVLALSASYYLSEEHIRTIIYRKRDDDKAD